MVTYKKHHGTESVCVCVCAVRSGVCAATCVFKRQTFPYEHFFHLTAMLQSTVFFPDFSIFCLSSLMSLFATDRFCEHAAVQTVGSYKENRDDVNTGRERAKLYEEFTIKE